MNLRLLAPDIQEHIHFLPRAQRGRDPIHLGQLQPIELEPDWRKQRTKWADLLQQRMHPSGRRRARCRDQWLRHFSNI